MPKSKIVELSYITGTPSGVVEHLKRSISLYLTRYNCVKIGITGRNPQTRFEEHLRNGNWDRMVVKYRTRSENFANTIETYFTLSKPELNNYWYGTSHLSEKENYKYVYILLKGAKTKLR